MQYSYDEVGSKLSVDDSINNTEPDNRYQYDYEDRLIQTRIGDDTITYTYDGDGMLVKKTITGSVNMTYEYFYDFTAGLPRLLVEKKSDGTTYNYLYVGGKLFGRKDATQTVYYHQDGLGSTVALTDENGNILNKYAYDPFGEPHILQETVENSMLFTGGPFDQSGLIYLRARYYDPKTGCFVSSDKYKGEIADPGSQNSYAYCGNNPINAVDPSGFDSYIYYDPNIHGKGTGEKYVKSDQKALEEKYGTPCHLIPTTNYEQFKEDWGKMGIVAGNEVSIDGVIIFNHGNKNSIMQSQDFFPILFIFVNKSVEVIA